ncbi:hypothetical protein KEM60_00388 [Austwickia sp. TVS 96-490-7B]|nr:hypothetical protein [Austwickia sp. TVS 96-490-7B]
MKGLGPTRGSWSAPGGALAYRGGGHWKPALRQAIRAFSHDYCKLGVPENVVTGTPFRLTNRRLLLATRVVNPWGASALRYWRSSFFTLPPPSLLTTEHQRKLLLISNTGP